MLQILISPSLLGYNVQGLTEDASKLKDVVHREGKAFLAKLAMSLSHVIGAYTIRSNKGSPAVCGEVTLHSEDIIIQLHQGFSDPGIFLFVRSCESSFDVAGGVNSVISLRELTNSLGQSEFISLVERSITEEKVRKSKRRENLLLQL